MKLTDYLASFLAEHGVRHAFGLTGGAVVHIFDSLERDPRLRVVFHHHEQAAAFAAEAASSFTGTPAVCVVTTGPGGTNAVTGLLGAWLNSIPCLFISGQARTEHLSQGTRVRQRGTQEFDIVRVVSPMVKAAVTLRRATDIRSELEHLWHLATTGRPGPVWLDLPLNLQWAEVDPAALPGWSEPVSTSSPLDHTAAWAKLRQLAGTARAPLVLLGNGVRLAGATAAFERFRTRHHLPVVTTWSSADLVPYAAPHHLGRIGMAGQRGANMAVNNCDILLAIGTHLPVPVTGNSRAQFAHRAQLVVVDIDGDELANLELPRAAAFQLDAGAFLATADSELPASTFSAAAQWPEYCRGYKAANDHFYHWEGTDGPLSHYRYMKALSRSLRADDHLVIDGGGTSNFIAFQSFENRAGQRMILSSGLCAMGSGLPEAIGVACAQQSGRTILICGDGSFQFNIQELQTVCHHRLPLKIFIAANNGYLSIRGTQTAFLEGRHYGSGFDGGLSLPNFARVAAAYDLPVFEIRGPADLQSTLDAVLADSGPAVTVVHVDDREEINPRQQFSAFEGGFRAAPLDDMAPPLPRDLYQRLTFPS